VLRLEALEDRWVLSGNVSASLAAIPGQLLIVGDAGDNKIGIATDPFGPTKSIRVVGLQGTTVNNAAFASFDMTAFTGINIIFQDGNNELHVDGPFPLANGLTGQLTINAGAGSNYFFINNITTNSLLLNAKGPGDNTLYMKNDTIGGTASINTGTGADTVWAQGVNAATMTINTGTGTLNDFVRVADNCVFGSLGISVGDGDENVSVVNSTITQGLTVTAGQHANEVNVTGNTIGSGATVRVGVGGQTNQLVRVNDNIFTQGDLNLTVGDGLDLNSTTSVSVARNKLATGSASVTVGNFAASVVLDTDTATGNGNGGGAVAVKVGTNAQVVTLTNVTASIAAARDVALTVGDGAGTVNMTNVQAGSNLRIDGSTDNANTNWNLHNLNVPNNFTFSTGTGRNTIAIDQVQQVHSITIGLGSGANALAAHAVSAAGGAINGGGNAQSVYFGVTDPANAGYNVFGFGIYH
jgi:hypothetical protein